MEGVEKIARALVDDLVVDARGLDAPISKVVLTKAHLLTLNDRFTQALQKERDQLKKLEKKLEMAEFRHSPICSADACKGWEKRFKCWVCELEKERDRAEAMEKGARAYQKAAEVEQERAEAAEARVKELENDSPFSRRVYIKSLEAKLRRAVESLANVTETAQKLWDEVDKPIMSGGAITVTHPTIEEAKQALKEIGVDDETTG